MSIDVNEEIKVWGGFTQLEFWGGAAALVLIVFCSIFLTVSISGWLGGLFLGCGGGGFIGLMVYQRDLPEGYLVRRFKQEGKFLFIKVPGIRGIDIYMPPSSERAKRFAAAFDEEIETNAQH